jgi:Contractile injection system tube protein/LysM domain
MAASGSLAKAFLRIENGDMIPCLFNPKEYTLARSNNWTYTTVVGKDLPEAQFGGGQPHKLTLSLLFDASEKPDGDVRKVTDKLFAAMSVQQSLATDGNDGRPPTIEFGWGETSTFKAVADSLSVQFLMFRSNGVPVRAQAQLSLTQVERAVGKAPGAAAKGQNPTTRGVAGLRSHVVKEGDTLQAIAFRSYGDPTRWRAIAEANGIDDPLSLRRGSVLSIPRHQ